MIMMMIVKLCGFLLEWSHNYRSRRELASLSERERHDIGFIGDINAEIAKPFWKR